MEFVKFIVVLTAIVVCCEGGIDFQDCGSKKGKISEVNIAGCKAEPCPLKKGTNVTFSVAFTSEEIVSKATSVVHGIIAGAPVPFPLDEPDCCKNSGLTCPLQANKAYNYQTSIFVRTIYPNLKLGVKWEMKDQNSDDVFCMMVFVQIVS